MTKAAAILFAAASLCPAAVDVRFETGSPVHVVVPGAANVSLVLSNDGSAITGASYFYRVDSFEQRGQLDIPASGSARVPVPEKVFGKLGLKRVEYGLEGQARKKSTFAYMRPTGPAKGAFLVGIAYGAGRDNQSTEAALAMSLCGVNVARLHPSWGAIQKTVESAADWESFDQALAVHAGRGITAQVLLSGTPGWARLAGTEKGGSAPPDPQAWRKWVRTVAQRYAGRVRFWEIWNEPDIDFFTGTTAQYMEMLRIAHEEIKAVNPKAQVLTGGFAARTHRAGKPGMIDAVLRDCRPYFDVFAYHRHGVFPDFRREIDFDVLPLRASLGAARKPLYFTETAMDTRFGERHQAETLVKKIAFSWSRGAMAHTWFNWRDKAGSEAATKPGDTYGLFTRDGNPKQSYVAFNTLTATLGKSQFVRQMPAPEGVWLLLFRSGSDYQLVAWHEGAPSATTPLPIQSDARRRWTVDLMGNRTEGTGPISATPVFYVLESAGSEPSTGEVAPVRANETVQRIATGQTVEFRLDRAEQFTFLRDHDPHLEAERWSGPADLSARISVTKTAAGLQIRADVDDDVASPGDAIEVLLEAPGRRWNLQVTKAGARLSFNGKPLEMAPGVVASAAPYRVFLPDAALGFTAAMWRSGARFDIRIHDDDGRGDSGYLSLLPVSPQGPSAFMLSLQGDGSQNQSIGELP